MTPTAGDVSESARPAVERTPSGTVPSAVLFGGRREIVILHHGQEYRLRITKADKLILTK